MAEIVCRSST